MHPLNSPCFEIEKIVLTLKCVECRLYLLGLSILSLSYYEGGKGVGLKMGVVEILPASSFSIITWVDVT
jgi:hypothetical protein